MPAEPSFSADPLTAIRQAEARLVLVRQAPADPVAAVLAALNDAWGGPVPAIYAEAGQRIGAEVARFGAAFPPGQEPAYHDRYHQAEATIVAGWLTGAAREAGQLDPRVGVCCVLALMGHDLFHPGVPGPWPGSVEAHSAAETLRLAGALPDDDLEAVRRLILLTDPRSPPPPDMPGRLVREADLFGSLTPYLGWWLSVALAREFRACGMDFADRVETYAGHLDVLRLIPAFTGAAVRLGLEAGRVVQVAALADAAAADSPEAGAVILDAMPKPEARRLYEATLTRLGLPGPTP